MSVKTYKEYEESQKVKPKTTEGLAKKSTPLLVREPIKEEEKKSYILFHPENPAQSYLNFTDRITLNGKEYKRICRNGTIKTDEKVLADYLIQSGYSLISIQEAQNG